MNTIHRVYIGARDTPGHKFLPNDENRIKKILKKYLRGWTITKSEGYWGGKAEETIILTVVESPQTRTGYGNGLASAKGEIASFLSQYAILWESNGTAVVVPTNRKPAAIVPPGATPPAARNSATRPVVPLAGIVVKRRRKAKVTVTNP